MQKPDLRFMQGKSDELRRAGSWRPGARVHLPPPPPPPYSHPEEAGQVSKLSSPETDCEALILILLDFSLYLLCNSL